MTLLPGRKEVIMKELKLTDSVTEVKGIGAKTEKALNKLLIFTVSDLVRHYPRGYDTYEPPVPITSVKEGEKAAIEASIITSPLVKQVRNLKIITIRVKDVSGSLSLSWFNMPFLKNRLMSGYHYIFRGKAARKNGALVIEQPEIYTREEYQRKMNILQPIYPLTEGITNNLLTKAIKTAMGEAEMAEDYLPKAVIKEYKLMNSKNALLELHFPKDKELLAQARRRLVFDEFFQFTLALSYLKESKKSWKNNFVLEDRQGCGDYENSLPYDLTGAQRRAWEEIRKDMKSEHTMNRLVQGDVGSGKTVLAALSLLLTALNGYQGCLMVPTEVLAQQHYETISDAFLEFGIQTVLLTGSMTAAAKRGVYERIKKGEVQIIIGTHALIQEKVEYRKLALVVTDEQHRFGVRQREMLSGKGEHPHVLVMSATPIPRTLAIILYGDLDISLVDELPAGRLPIKNCVVDTGYRSTAYRFIGKQLEEGRQAYVICPMVEESEVIEAENVIEYTEKLKEALPFAHVEYLHGKMKPQEKNDIMERFSKGEIQVLVSTTVVEVGVNVPNATVMMIENAERFGLAQLHQLRGRVGRGKYQSYCILVCGREGKDIRKRLEIMNQSNDGFYIAGEDLKLRGPGDMFGIRQSGEMEFKLGDIYQDAKVLMEANEAAKKLTKEELEAIFLKSPELKLKIVEFKGGTL
ncbi:ATP-dependent DNA helicase RecG [Anaerocolumna jejuensis DSM 15929]|uniref:ATP-dependent DNA helicase RecG n=1 Tax=Anaerocolumna jejuensis DSM 15929 TaxID=1121322 RepID=A0A1M6P0L9_9FIRM|nr:ATP-dependent DNA helicase RecG [Anaerocolumna jejuensis]SHK01466.1 ATP-dependent DNA helicase RecG [Anaerocolumna jejuensis DSM 15929]